MPAYAIAHLTDGDEHPDIQVYIDRIQSTMDPHEGLFRVHGGTHETIEGGPNPDFVVMLEFPTMQQARNWYADPAYRAILPLRTDHMNSTVILVEGVPEGYRPGP